MLGGALTGAAVFAAFLIGHRSNLALGQTMAFTTLVFSKLTYVYAIRGEGWFFRAGRNRSLHAAVLLSALVGAAVLAIPPLWEGFGVVAMDAGDVAVCVALTLLPFAGAEALKAVRRTRGGSTLPPRSR